MIPVNPEPTRKIWICYGFYPQIDGERLEGMIFYDGSSISQKWARLQRQFGKRGTAIEDTEDRKIAGLEVDGVWQVTVLQRYTLPILSKDVLEAIIKHAQNQKIRTDNPQSGPAEGAAGPPVAP